MHSTSQRLQTFNSIFGLIQQQQNCDLFDGVYDEVIVTESRFTCFF